MDSSDEDDWILLLLISQQADKRGDKTGLTRCVPATDTEPEGGGGAVAVAVHHRMTTTMDGDAHAAAVLALRPLFGCLARVVQKAAQGGSALLCRCSHG
jgi:hypothetical protein